MPEVGLFHGGSKLHLAHFRLVCPHRVPQDPIVHLFFPLPHLNKFPGTGFSSTGDTPSTFRPPLLKYINSGIHVCIQQAYWWLVHIGRDSCAKEQLRWSFAFLSLGQSSNEQEFRE